MSKFKELLEATIKEWNYPEWFDDSILDGDDLDSGEWLNTAFAVKVLSGQFPDGVDLTDLYALPSYVLYQKEDKALDLTEELLPDGPTTIRYVNGKRIEDNVTSYSVFYKAEEAEQVLAEFKTQFLNVDAEVVEVYGYGDNPYYEDEEKAIMKYKADYKEDQYFADADDHDDYDD